MPRCAAILAALLVACQGEPKQPPGPDPIRVLPDPALRTIAPTAIRAGEEVTIFGQGFADRAVGETRLSFEGTYQSTSGPSNPVKLEVVPVYKNQGVLTWVFGPNIPFSTLEDTGTFRGVLRARSVGLDGATKDAAPIGVEMQVLPSILIRQLRPEGAGCDAGITETVDDAKLTLELKAVGLKAGTSIAPLRFIYTFLKDSFQFTGTFGSALAIDPESLFPKQGPISVIDDVTSGTTSTLGSAARAVYVYKGGYAPSLTSIAGGVDNLFGLTALATAPLPAAADYVDAVINVVAVDSTGAQTSRALPLRIWTRIEVSYSGGFRTVRSFDPVPVSGCIPGGDIGRDVSYAENTSETRSRTFTVTSKVSGGVDVQVARINAEFGVDVQANVSSSSSKDLQISGKVLPKEYAVLYRQTLQLERRGTLRGHGPCGTTQDLGEVVVTDWTWSPDLAKGPTCPPLPPSNLPKGQIY
jgi:hypothetical protein